MNYYSHGKNHTRTYYYIGTPIERCLYVSGDYDPTTDRNRPPRLTFFRRDTRIHIHVMPFPSSPLHHVSVSPDGKTFCLSDWDRPLEAYDVKSGERLWRSSLRRYRHILCADTHWLTIYEDRMLVQLSADTGEITARIPARMRNTSLFDFSPHFCLLPLRRERWGILRKDTLEIVQELPDAAFPSGILLDAWLRGARPALLRQRRIGEERMLYMDEAEYHLDPAVCADYDAVTEKQRTAFLTDMLRRNYAIQGQIHICP